MGSDGHARESEEQKHRPAAPVRTLVHFGFAPATLYPPMAALGLGFPHAVGKPATAKHPHPRGTSLSPPTFLFFSPSTHSDGRKTAALWPTPSPIADPIEEMARWSPLSPVAHPPLRWVRRRRAEKPASHYSLPPEGGAPSSDASAFRCASDREGMGRPCGRPPLPASPRTLR